MNTFLSPLLTCMMAVLSLSSTGAFALTPGDILVIEADAGTDVRGALFRLDPVTGERSLLSASGAT